MGSVQLQKPVEIPQAQAPTHSKPSEQHASSIQTRQRCEDSNIVEGVNELLHIEKGSTKTEHEHQSLSQSHVEKPLASAKEGVIGGILVEKKKKDKKDKDKKEKDKKEKDKSPKTHDKKEKKKNKNKDEDSSGDDARSKAKKLEKEKKKHK